MLALPNAHLHCLQPLQLRSQTAHFPINSSGPYKPNFPALQPAQVIPRSGIINNNIKELNRCHTAYNFNAGIRRNLPPNHRLLTNIYRPALQPVSVFRPQNTVLITTNQKPFTNHRFINQERNMFTNHQDLQTLQDVFYQNSIPPFAVFGNIIPKDANMISSPPAKSGFEQGKMDTYSNCCEGFDYAGKTHKKQLNHQNTVAQPVSEGKSDIKKQRNLKRTREDNDVHSDKTDSLPKQKTLRHSIASILDILPKNSDEELSSDELEDEKQWICANAVITNEDVTEANFDVVVDEDSMENVDVTSISESDTMQDENVVSSSTEDHNTECHDLSPEDVDDVEKPHKNSDTFPASDYENENSSVHDQGVKMKSSNVNQNEHLLKLETLINEEDKNRFNSQNFFMSQVDMFKTNSPYITNCQEEKPTKTSISANCGTGKDKHFSLQQANDKRLHSGNPPKSSISNEPTTTLPPIQTLCHNYQQMDTDERSAFKPIIKTGPAKSLPDFLAPYLHRSTGSFTSPNVDPSILQQNAPRVLNGNIGKHNIPESEIQRQKSVDMNEEKVRLDAITMLRHRSSVYQRHGFSENHVQASVSTSSEHLPSTLGAWLTWLRRREAGTTNSTHLEQQAPARVPPPPRYHCEACNKTYSTFGGLSKHRQFHCAQHVKKEFACKVCNKAYSSLGALKMHIRTHTLPCKCHVCGKAFSRPWLLQGHVRTHTGEKPFRCNHCGRAFADRSNLRAHLQTHAEIKKYACKKCGKTFSRMSLLTKHSEGSCPGNLRATTDH